MRVALVNDTNGPHAGCQLVTEAFRYQLGRVGVELLGTVPKVVKSVDRYPDFVRQADLVIVNGEGSIHHGARQELVELASRFPAILVNCVYQQNPPNAALGHFALITARESKSAAAFAEHGVQAEVIPDVMLTAPTLISFPHARPVLDVGVTDNVLQPREGISALVGEGRAIDYIATLSNYRRLCIGRFHGILIAASLGIPFSAWASNTHKTEAVMSDMGVPHLFATTREDALRLVPGTLPPSIPDYIASGRAKVEGLFDRLESLA